MIHETMKKISDHKPGEYIMLSQVAGLWTDNKIPVGEDIPLGVFLDFVIEPDGRCLLRKITFEPKDDQGISTARKKDTSLYKQVNKLQDIRSMIGEVVDELRGRNENLS